MSENNTIVIYSRKSRYTGKGESIENQIEICRQYIRIQYGEEYANDAIVYEDEGFSGGSLNRPQFKEMMGYATTNPFKALVVYRLDRISRNISDFVKLIDFLTKLRIDFISVKEQFDTASPMGRAMMYMSSVFSQLERETIAERIRDNMHELAKTGRWLGGVSPFGYKGKAYTFKLPDGRKKRICRLELIKNEAEAVKLIYNKFLETESIAKTMDYLNQNQLLTRNSKSYSRFTVRRILMNPVYAMADDNIYTYLNKKDICIFGNREEFNGKNGLIAYNRTEQKNTTNRFRPIEEWIIAVGEHEGIISGAEWVRSWEIFQTNRLKTMCDYSK